MKIKLYQVDAFSAELFTGNPAAVCPLSHWLDDDLMQKIAQENNLSETAFIVPNQNLSADDQCSNNADYAIRWFTPTNEVDLCGHASMAAAHVIFNHIGINGSNQITFETTSRGNLMITALGDAHYQLDFPSLRSQAIQFLPSTLSDSLSIQPKEIYADLDYLLVYDSPNEIKQLQINYPRGIPLEKRGIIATAANNNENEKYDCVSRCFYPTLLDCDEDPVTGSAHCMIIPFWAERLNQTELLAHQASKRGGELRCKFMNDRVLLSGKAITYLDGVIFI